MNTWQLGIFRSKVPWSSPIKQLILLLISGAGSSLISNGAATEAALFDAENRGVWAISPGYRVYQGELHDLIDLFKNPNSAFEKGIVVDGKSYTCIQADDKFIYGRMNTTGVACAKTGKLIILAYYDESKMPGEAALAVEKTAEKFRDPGY